MGLLVIIYAQSNKGHMFQFEREYVSAKFFHWALLKLDLSRCLQCDIYWICNELTLYNTYCLQCDIGSVMNSLYIILLSFLCVSFLPSIRKVWINIERDV